MSGPDDSEPGPPQTSAHGATTHSSDDVNEADGNRNANADLWRSADQWQDSSQSRWEDHE